MVCLIHVFQGNVEPHLTSFFVSKVAVSFNTEAIINVDCNLMTYKAVPIGIEKQHCYDSDWNKAAVVSTYLILFG